MIDPLSAIPLWSIMLIVVALGAMVGFAIAWRRWGRFLGLSMVAAFALLLGASQALGWDWKTLQTPLGGSADHERQLAMQALGGGQTYARNRQRWLAMTPDEKMQWRLAKFALTAGPALAAGVAAFLAGGGGSTRRATR